MCHPPASPRCPGGERPAPWSRPSGSRQPNGLSSLPSNTSRSGGPPSPQRHAISDQSPAEFDLHLFEAAQAGLDVPAGPLERSRQRRRVSSRLGGRATRVRPDDERRVAEEAHPADDRAPPSPLHARLPKRLPPSPHQ